MFGTITPDRLEARAYRMLHELSLDALVELLPTAKDHPSIQRIVSESARRRTYQTMATEAYKAGQLSFDKILAAWEDKTFDTEQVERWPDFTDIWPAFGDPAELGLHQWAAVNALAAIHDFMKEANVDIIIDENARDINFAFFPASNWLDTPGLSSPPTQTSLTDLIQDLVENAEGELLSIARDALAKALSLVDEAKAKHDNGEG